MMVDHAPSSQAELHQVLLFNSNSKNVSTGMMIDCLFLFHCKIISSEYNTYNGELTIAGIS